MLRISLSRASIAERLMSRERYKQSVLVSTDVRPGVLGTPVSPLRGLRLFFSFSPPLPQWATLFRPFGTFGEIESLYWGSCRKRLAAK
jgi:hypothetical protein